LLRHCHRPANLDIILALNYSHGRRGDFRQNHSLLASELA